MAAVAQAAVPAVPTVALIINAVRGIIRGTLRAVRENIAGIRQIVQENIAGVQQRITNIINVVRDGWESLYDVLGFVLNLPGIAVAQEMEVINNRLNAM